MRLYTVMVDDCLRFTCDTTIKRIAHAGFQLRIKLGKDEVAIFGADFVHLSAEIHPMGDLRISPFDDVVDRAVTGFKLKCGLYFGQQSNRILL